MSEIEVKIGQEIDRSGIAIRVLKKLNGDVFALNLYTGESKLLKPYEEIPKEFLIRISDYIAHEFFLALAEALDKQGIKTDKDAKIQGTLEATRYHLEDLRKLLKLKTTPTPGGEG